MGLYVCSLDFYCLKFVYFDCVIYSGDVCMKGEGLVNVGIVVGQLYFVFDFGQLFMVL